MTEQETEIARLEWQLKLTRVSRDTLFLELREAREQIEQLEINNNHLSLQLKQLGKK